ncbi:MAG: hypothetical protein LBD92_00025 [Oscillospiraceae bacterium]|jgi:hypothetical protein|nr:hypothetical protein [Oscillospiraceae bacterium]
MKKLVSTLLIVTLLAMSGMTVLADRPQLPDTIIIDGREFVVDEAASAGRNSAIYDNSLFIPLVGYTVLGSDVHMYIDYSHGHGGDQFASGWVQTNAPSFYARAEVRLNGQTVVTGINTQNSAGSDIAYSNTPLAIGIDNNRTANIFYGWL